MLEPTDHPVGPFFLRLSRSYGDTVKGKKKKRMETAGIDKRGTSGAYGGAGPGRGRLRRLAVPSSSPMAAPLPATASDDGNDVLCHSLETVPLTLMALPTALPFADIAAPLFSTSGTDASQQPVSAVQAPSLMSSGGTTTVVVRDGGRTGSLTSRRSAAKRAKLQATRRQRALAPCSRAICKDERKMHTPPWMPGRLYYATDMSCIAFGGKFPVYLPAGGGESARFEWVRVVEPASAHVDGITGARVVGRIHVWQERAPCVSIAAWLVSTAGTPIVSYCSDARQTSTAWIEWNVPLFLAQAPTPVSLDSSISPGPATVSTTESGQATRHDGSAPSVPVGRVGETGTKGERACRATYDERGALVSWEWIAAVTPANVDSLLINDEINVLGPWEL